MKITSSYLNNGKVNIDTVDNAVSIMSYGDILDGDKITTFIHASTWDNVVDTVVKANGDTTAINRLVQRSRKAKNVTASSVNTDYDYTAGEYKLIVDGDDDNPIMPNVNKRFTKDRIGNDYTVEIHRHDNQDSTNGDIRNVIRIYNGYKETPDAVDIDLYMETTPGPSGDRFGDDPYVNIESIYGFRGNKKISRATAGEMPTLAEYRIVSAGSSLKSDTDAYRTALETLDVDDFGFVEEDCADVSFISIEKLHTGFNPLEKITWKEMTKEYTDEEKLSYYTSVIDVTEGLRTDVYSCNPPKQEYRFFQTKEDLKVLSYRSGNSATSPCSYDFSIIYKNDGRDEEVYLVRKYLESEADIDFDVYSSLEKLAYIKECYTPAMSASVWEFDAPSVNVSTAKCYAYIAFGPEFINNGSLNPETALDRVDAFKRLTTFISNFSLFTTKTSDPVIQDARYIIEAFGRFLSHVPAGDFCKGCDHAFKRDMLALWKREIEMLTIEPHYGKSIRNLYDNIEVCDNYARSELRK